MTNWGETDTPFPKTCELLESFGFKPGNIMLTGLDSKVYRKVVRDSFGDKKHTLGDDGEWHVLTEWVEWPTLEIGLAVVDCFMGEGGYK